MVSTRHLVTLATAAIGGVAITMTAVPAYANTFSASELTYDDALLSQFNLVTLSTASTSYYSNPSTAANTNGRVIIGGGANFGNDHVCYSVSTNACVGNSTSAIESSGAIYGAVTVFGNVTANAVLGRANGGGDVAIQGTTSGFIAAGSGKYGFVGSTSGLIIDGAGSISTTQSTFAGNSYNAAQTGAGVTPQVNQTLASVFPYSSASLANITTEAKDLYSGLANLPGSPGVSAQSLPSSYSGVFTASTDYTANGKNYGVVTTTLANFEAEGSNFTGVANGSNDAATFVIITGTGGTLPTITDADPKVIYDFVSASSLTVSTAFDGTILAPLASLTQSSSSGTINGSVVVASITQNADLYNTNAFTGDLSGLNNFTYNARVPEPASIAIFGSGMAGLAWLRRKRKK